MSGRSPEQEVNPLQGAINRFEKLASSPKYDASALQRALNSVITTGTRLGTSPGELYANLAVLTEMAVDLAGKHGQEDEQQAFLEQQQAFQQTSELLSQGGEIILPTSPSQPQRTTGRAAG